jgi:FdhD protein
MEYFEITSINRGLREKKTEGITEEVPLTIEINRKELATLLASPFDFKQLTLGFLFTSGLIEGISEVKSLVIDEECWKANVELNHEGFSDELFFKRVYTSGCGKGVIFHNPLDLIQRVKLPAGFEITSEKILEIMKIFLSSSAEHRETRGVHSAALAGQDGILIFMDDIGRHNALDKVVGEAMMRKIDFGKVMVLTTGRISSEIVAKVMRCGIPVVVSRGVPTNQAIKMAKEIRMTLAGYARGHRMNIYTIEERIK